MSIFQRKLKKISFKILFFTFLTVGQLGFFVLAKAQEKTEEPKVDYADKIIIDSDLDGLTDEGELQIFKTDPLKPDTDGDGFFDGVEILNEIDPLDPVNSQTREAAELTGNYLNRETPWIWYFSRSSGILAYVFLWFSIFLGLSIRNVFLRKIIEPIYSFDFHAFVSVLAVFWGLLHGISFLLHDGEYFMSLKEIFIPFYSDNKLLDKGGLALGIILLYVLIVLVLTSYFRKNISFKIWRISHFLNIIVLPLVAIHAIVLGTDIENETIKILFLTSIVVLIPLYFMNLINIFLTKKTTQSEVANKQSKTQ